MKAKMIREVSKTKTKLSSSLDKTYPESQEADNFLIKVRCPGCGNLLTYINIGDHEVSVRRRFFCKNCRDTLLVLVNPAMVPPAM